MGEIKKLTVRIYRDENEKEPYTKWIDSLKDPITRARIRRRLRRLEEGNMGDVTPVGGGVSELRFHFGPGYWVYFGEHEEALLLLLWGGDKGSQIEDVKKAKLYWFEFKESLK
jgi:putative addiction module killer protein